MRLDLPAIAVACVLGTGACSPTVTTIVRVHDPGGVEIRDGERVVVPAGSGAADEPLRSGSVRTGDASSAAYEVRATRDGSGALSLHWITTLPLHNGDRHALVSADGQVAPSAVEGASLVPPRPSEAALVLPSCGWLAAPLRGGAREVVAGQACSSPYVYYQAALVTPWSNVVEVRERRAHLVAGSADAYRFTTFWLGASGAILLGTAEVAAGFSSAAPPVKGTVIGVSTLLAIPLVYWMLQPAESTRVLYSGPR